MISHVLTGKRRLNTKHELIRF